MSAIETQFWALLPETPGADQASASTRRAADLTLDVIGRPVQVRLDERGLLHVSTAVFLNDGDAAQVLCESIAEFNAVHLFAGGYCLLVQPESGSLYVDQIVSPQRFDRKSFQAFLIDFAHRATGCMRWYAEALTREKNFAS